MADDVPTLDESTGLKLASLDDYDIATFSIDIGRSSLPSRILPTHIGSMEISWSKVE